MTLAVDVIAYLNKKYVYMRATGLFIRRFDALNRPKGTPAGGFASGYRMLYAVGKFYPASQLVWLMEHGEFSTADLLDHKDGIKSNDFIDNLREASHTQNKYNVGLRSSNTSGVKGVSVEYTGNFVAHIRINGVKKRLGTYKTIEEAAEAYRQAALQHHGDFIRLD